MEFPPNDFSVEIAKSVVLFRVREGISCVAGCFAAVLRRCWWWRRWPAWFRRGGHRGSIRCRHCELNKLTFRHTSEAVSIDASSPMRDSSHLHYGNVVCPVCVNLPCRSCPYEAKASRPQNSHSVTSFKSRRSASRSSEVIFRWTLSSAVSLTSISRSRYFLPLAVSSICIALPDFALCSDTSPSWANDLIARCTTVRSKPRSVAI
jgi:hypothetical protein